MNNVLKERGSRYGSFKDNAYVTQNLINWVYAGANSQALTFEQIEALQMICHKISRIVNGDPDYKDSWVDIAGYATLVAEGLE